MTQCLNCRDPRIETQRYDPNIGVEAADIESLKRAFKNAMNDVCITCKEWREPETIIKEMRDDFKAILNLALDCNDGQVPPSILMHEIRSIAGRHIND